MHRSRSIFKALTAALFLAALSIGGASVAGAQTTPTAPPTPEECVNYVTYSDTVSIGSTPATVSAGQVVTVSGSGFPANIMLNIELNGTFIRSVITDANGTFSFDYTATAAEAGRTLVFSTDFCSEALSTNVTVSTSGGGGQSSGGGGGTGTGTGSTTLPQTGSDSADLARVGVLLLGAGALAVAATRRKKAQSTTV